MQTGIPYVFAAGDVVAGPTMITTAAGLGRRAASLQDRWMQDQSMDGYDLDTPLPIVDKASVLARDTCIREMTPKKPGEIMRLAPGEFYPDEETLTENEVLSCTSRCLDCGVCSQCNSCVDICPADCIDLNMKDEEVEVEVDAVVLATGYTLFPAELKPQYGYGKYKNVITGMQMDRLLAPTRPYNGVLRPGDGKVPGQHRLHPLHRLPRRDHRTTRSAPASAACTPSSTTSSIMGALPLADVTVYYMDVRAVGKGYDEFYEQAKGMGASFVKGRVAEITEKDDGNLILQYEDIENAP